MRDRRMTTIDERALRPGLRELMPAFLAGSQRGLAADRQPIYHLPRLSMRPKSDRNYKHELVRSYATARDTTR